MNEIKKFYSKTKERLANAGLKLYSIVYFAMVEAYWLIGKRIVEEEQGQERAEYGKYLIRELSKKLSAESGKGFSHSKQWNFRHFHLTFRSQEKLYTLHRELTWTHYRGLCG